MTIVFRGKSLLFQNVLLDTRSAGTILRADRAAEIGIEPEPFDITHVIRGIGGTEFVYVKTIETVRVDDMELYSFRVELGQMDYGYEMDGIMGFNFIQSARMIIDARNLEIRF